MTISRRQAFQYALAGLTGAVALPRRAPGQERPGLQTLPERDSLTGELRWPEVAGRSRGRVTDYENDPHIIGIEERLRCTCGCNLSVYTCRTTDFTCGTSPMLHRQVIDLVESGKTADEVLEAFVAQYGETVLMAPPKVGFNWAAYLLPGVVITAVGAVLVWVLRRRAALGPVPATASGDGAGGTAARGLSTDEQERLEAELSGLDR